MVKHGSRRYTEEESVEAGKGRRRTMSPNFEMSNSHDLFFCFSSKIACSPGPVSHPAPLDSMVMTFNLDSTGYDVL